MPNLCAYINSSGHTRSDSRRLPDVSDATPVAHGHLSDQSKDTPDLGGSLYVCRVPRGAILSRELKRLQYTDGEGMPHLAKSVVDAKIDRVFLDQPEPSTTTTARQQVAV